VKEKNVKLYHGDCLEVMKRFSEYCIDLTVTSPPYDNLRTYNNTLVWNENIWQSVAKELFRVTKSGGVVVWVVNDATIKGSETGSSFKQALYFKEVGFNLHDTMIWNKGSNASVGGLNRYADKFEYMFIFSKGIPLHVNIIHDRKNKRAGEIQHGSIRQKDGTVRKTTGYGKRKIKEFGRRYNIWDIFPEKSNSNRCHPAQFPEQLANDHIISWSNENDTVFDPFLGSGTTGRMAVLNNRKFIGIEKDEKYFEIAKKRIEAVRGSA